MLKIAAGELQKKPLHTCPRRDQADEWICMSREQSPRTLCVWYTRK